MINNTDRVKRFTSSNMHKLVKFGSRLMTPAELTAYKKANPKSAAKTMPAGFAEAGRTYIAEKRIERRLGKSVEKEAYSQDMAWGKFLELILFNKLGSGYIITSKDTEIHPKYPELWAGSADLQGRHKDFIAEIKCYQLKKFCLYTDCLLQQSVPLLKENFPEEYWQIVSNCDIHGVDYGEAISFAPYESEMPLIKDLAENYDGPDQWMYRFIAEKPISSLACIPDGGYYKDINKFRFKVPQDDINFLRQRVVEAGKELLAP